MTKHSLCQIACRQISSKIAPPNSSVCISDDSTVRFSQHRGQKERLRNRTLGIDGLRGGLQKREGFTIELLSGLTGTVQVADDPQINETSRLPGAIPQRSVQFQSTLVMRRRLVTIALIEIN